MVRPPYEVVARIFGIAEDHWAAIDGQCALKGVENLLNLSISRFCNAIVQWAMERVKDPEMFMHKLETVSGSQASDLAKEREAAENAKFMSAFGMG